MSGARGSGNDDVAEDTGGGTMDVRTNDTPDFGTAEIPCTWSFLRRVTDESVTSS
jgi:hypothetical protein